jgi:23S rRNA pseudouridine955/2504/2580 synthase
VPKGRVTVKEIVITQELNQLRVDKVCHKIFKDVPTSFMYKMFRKKNIVLNDKKILGHELVNVGDCLKFYFSEESFEKLSSNAATHTGKALALGDNHKRRTLDRDLILYEDANILVYNKPVGILSQPNGKDLSLIELYHNHQQITSGDLDLPIAKTLISLDTFGVCNRLDRNTTGITLIGKNPASLKMLNTAIKEKNTQKIYHAVVSGILTHTIKLKDFLIKDERTNQVKIIHDYTPGCDLIETDIEPISASRHLGLSLVKIYLHTGKTHQIRAHLSSIGYPIVGDSKYGDQRVNLDYKANYGIEYQLLHSYSYTFLHLPNQLEYLQNKSFVAPYFSDMETIVALITK